MEEQFLLAPPLPKKPPLIVTRDWRPAFLGLAIFMVLAVIALAIFSDNHTPPPPSLHVETAAEYSKRTRESQDQFVTDQQWARLQAMQRLNPTSRAYQSIKEDYERVKWTRAEEYRLQQQRKHR